MPRALNGYCVQYSERIICVIVSLYKKKKYETYVAKIEDDVFHYKRFKLSYYNDVRYTMFLYIL